MNENTHKSPRRFDKELKLAALELWRTSGKTRKEVAEELGISEWPFLSFSKTAPVVRSGGFSNHWKIRQKSFQSLEKWPEVGGMHVVFVLSPCP